MSWVDIFSFLKNKAGDSREVRSGFIPSNQVLSVMFVDIAGFSLTAQVMEPDEVFKRLNGLLSPLSEIVIRFGGVIDKNIGDGFLCFFGDGEQPEKESIPHAQRAIQCACEMQKLALEISVKSSEERMPVFPLRIGINTAQVFIGDIGGPHRIEFTIFGHGVNLAQRLEQACESFRILVSTETLKGWKTLDLNSVSIHKRQVQIKHREEVFEAFEINPLVSEEEKLGIALRSYREGARLMRKEPRIPFETRFPVAINVDPLDGVLLNFSRSGFSVETDAYFGKGTVINIRPETFDSVFQNICRSYNAPSVIKAEVRWGRARDSSYVHGLQIIDLSENQKDAFFQAMKEYQEISFSCQISEAA